MPACHDTSDAFAPHFPARPAGTLTPLAARPQRNRGRVAGYFLLEALIALGVVGIGILPVAWLAPGAMQWWRQQAIVAQAMRIAAEAAELGAPAAGGTQPSPAPLPPVAPRDARGLPPPRWCMAVPEPEAGDACPPGPRVVVVGPLPSPPRSPATGTPSTRGLRAIALWLQP